MASFAEVLNDEVIRVLVVNNSDILNEDGSEDPKLALNFLPKTDGEWIQCSYNSNFRGVFPGIGYKYNKEKDEFEAPLVYEVTAKIGAETEQEQ